MFSIRDGQGGKYLAGVDSKNRLRTRALTTTESENALKEGRAYNLNTGVLTLTDDVDTPVMYVKNNESSELHIKAIAVGLGASDGTAGEPVKITIIRNPTAGTIISSPTNVDINSNRNYGSSDTFDADAYKGATGDTMTDGDDHIIFFQNESGRLFASIDEYLPKGTTIGIKIEAPSGNTSMECYTALVCHLENGD